MKAIINGKRYDTDKATEVASASSAVGRRDFSFWREVLYKTPRSGAYFLAGEGHARSHYATDLGGGAWGPGEKITPLTADQALAWLERNRLTEAIEAEFGDRIEDA